MVAPQKLDPLHVAQVRQMVQEHLSGAEIARRTGFSLYQVGYIKRVCNIKGGAKVDTEWTVARIERLREAAAADVPDRELAAELGTTVAAVRSGRTRFGIKLATVHTRLKEPTAEKKCNSCLTVLPISCFQQTSGRGQRRHRPSCRICTNKSKVSARHGAVLVKDRPCDICGGLAEVIDHQHTEGVSAQNVHDAKLNRGQLCHSCNRGLGLFGDSLVKLQSAAVYLRTAHTGWIKPAIPLSLADGTLTPAARHRLATYGLDAVAVSQLRKAQGGCCAICRVGLVWEGSHQEMISGTAAAIDHEHTSGAIRGVLCFDCNRGVGQLHDSAELIDKAAQYLISPPGLPSSLSDDKVISVAFAKHAAALKEAGFILTSGPYGLPLWQREDTPVILYDPAQLNWATFKGFSRSPTHLLEEFSALRDQYPTLLVCLPDQPLSPLLNTLAYRQNNRETLGARETTLVQVSEVDARTFLDVNHLQGHTPALHRLGLTTSTGELVALMTFNTPDRTRAACSDWLLQRFCSTKAVAGGASKLLAAFRKAHPGSIVSYSDPMYAHGRLYGTLGFTAVPAPHSAEYAYWRDDRLYPKSGKQKRHLHRELDGLGQSWDPSATEFQLAASLGYIKFPIPGKTRWHLPALG